MICLEHTTAIELRHITKRFGKVVANDDISLEIRRGEILSLLGENGSGKIINIASISGCVAFVDQSIYCAAKGGVVNMTRELGVELAPFGINVNAICPSVVDTPLFIDINSPLEGKFLQDCIDGHPIGRISTPDDIAGPAVFLASDDASFICGHILMVDGGWTAK